MLVTAKGLRMLKGGLDMITKAARGATGDVRKFLSECAGWVIKDTEP